MRRQGFTLVEMMVSLALVLFIMVILSQAFQAGLESFRFLKSIGDMDERMRSAATLLRRDLAADHFEGKRRISDESFWIQGPPREGFFRIWHGTPTSAISLINVFEGADGDQVLSTRATDHMLHFSVKLRGNQRQDFVSASVPLMSPLIASQTTFLNQATDARYQEQQAASPRGEYRSQWFEVVYYLRQSGTTVLPDSPGGGPGTPLFALIRRQLVVAPDNSHLNWASQPNTLRELIHNVDGLREYSEISCKKSTLSLDPLPNLYPGGGDPLYFNNPTDITIPPRRFGMLPLLSNNQFTGRRERAGLPSVPLLDPNDVGQAAAVNAGRVYPILGEMFYQNQKLRNVPQANWPTWYKKWLSVSSPDARADIISKKGLPPIWQDNPALRGADVLLTDVVSFQVKVLIPGFNEFMDLFDDHLPHTNSVFSDEPGRPILSPRVFDTWSSVKDDQFDYSSWSHPGTPVSAPSQVRILALQITLRVWDHKAQQTRQITLVQDM